MKKSLAIILALVVIISGIIFVKNSKNTNTVVDQENNNGMTNVVSNCVKEGEKSYGEAPVVYQCCPGLKMIGAIDGNGITTYDVAYCTKCGDNNCKEPENQYNCPADCK